MGNTARAILSMIAAILFTIIVLGAAGAAFGQTIIPANAITSIPTITIAGGAADTTPSPTTGSHELLVQFKFGTVAGSYASCTVQAKTALDGINYLVFGSPKSITVVSGGNNMWRLVESTGAASSTTTTNSIGAATKFTFACSGGYGTSAPVAVLLLALPTDAASVAGVCASGSPVQGTAVVSSTTTSNLSLTMSDGTTFTAQPSQRLELHSYQVVNTGATNALITFTMDNPAPTTLAYGVAPTNTTPFGGSNVTLPTPIFTTAANKAMSIGASAGSTSIYVSAQGCMVP